MASPVGQLKNGGPVIARLAAGLEQPDYRINFSTV
jgi:hypothetical protein